MNYRQLQSALKEARNNGFALTVKLNAKKEVLQAEYNRFSEETSTEKEADAVKEPEVQQEASQFVANKEIELGDLVTKAAESRGFYSNEAKAFSRQFFKCWSEKGYTTAYYRYLIRL